MPTTTALNLFMVLAIFEAMSGLAPWDESESVVDALERWGLLDAFNIVVAGARVEEAVLVLERIGVDRNRAERIVDGVVGEKEWWGRE
ncbi:MAG: hypothetical protein QM775_27855 [Pirellulales bacterium]